MAGESGRPHRKLEVWQRSMALPEECIYLDKEQTNNRRYK